MNKFKARHIIHFDCLSAMYPTILVSIFRDAFVTVIAVYTAVFLGEFADATFALNLEWGIENLWKLVGCLVLAVLIIPVIEILRERIMFSNALKHDKIVIGRFLDMEYKRIVDLGVGNAQYRLEHDPNDFRFYWADFIIKVISTPLIFAFVLLYAIPISFTFTLVIIVLSATKLVIPFALQRFEAKYDFQERAYKTEVGAFESDIAKRPHEVKMLGLQNFFIRKLNSIFIHYFSNTQTKSIKYKAISKNSILLVNTVCVFVIIIVGSIMVAKETITPGDVVSMAAYFALFNTVFDNATEIISQLPILKNLHGRLSELYSDAEDESGVNINEIASIKVENLCFSFDGKEVISNLNFQINKGEKVAICGENGSGKSTLIKIIGSLLKDYSGNIFVNDIRLEEISVKSFRNEMSFAPQEAFLFKGSIRENVTLTNESATDKEVDLILEQLGLLALSELKVSVKNDSLSGGEKQKISIARCIVKGSNFIILDEPTNNLDEKSLTWLREYITNTDKSVLFVSHDKDFIDIADRIICID